MAKLTLTQANRKIEREKAKQETIRKKMEIEKMKEAFGENWKQIIQDNIQRDIEIEIGGDKTPKIYDSQDLYEFFSPINFYKDSENEILKMDFQKFTESENKYQIALDKLNQELEDFKHEKDDKKETEDKEVNETSGGDEGKSEESENRTSESGEPEVNKRSLLLTDGVSEMDDLIPIAATDLDENEQLIEKSKVDSPVARAKGKLNQIVGTYFNRFVPLYNKHVCTCCGVPKQLNDYYVVFNMTCSDRVDPKGSFHMWVCKECVQKLFAYYYTVLSKKNVELAMQYLCASLNLYWDVDVFYIAKKEFEDKGRKGTLVGSYIAELNRNHVGKTFMDSPFITDEQYNSANRKIATNKDEAPYDWSREDAKNKKDIIHILGYDPFEYEDNDEDKKILYADLVSIIDEDIQQDYVKLQSALTIVKSFHKVRKLDERAHQLEKEDAPLNEQKAIAELKAKELKAISDFSRDSGFSERFKTRQSLGETSFTGIVKKMNEKKYEDELINKYDVQTSSTIQAAADASFKAIFNQLNLSEAEAFQLAAEQLQELRKIRQENEKLQEDLRQAKYELAEERLREKAREKGVDDEDD